VEGRKSEAGDSSSRRSGSVLFISKKKADEWRWYSYSIFGKSRERKKRCLAHQMATVTVQTTGGGPFAGWKTAFGCWRGMYRA